MTYVCFFSKVLKLAKEKWGDFADVDKMKDHINKAGLDLELIDRDEPVDFSDDPDGRMFTLAFKKTKAPSHKSVDWLLQKADDLKQAGNSHLEQNSWSSWLSVEP